MLHNSSTQIVSSSSPSLDPTDDGRESLGPFRISPSDASPIAPKPRWDQSEGEYSSETFGPLSCRRSVGGGRGDRQGKAEEILPCDQ